MAANKRHLMMTLHLISKAKVLENHCRYFTTVLRTIVSVFFFFNYNTECFSKIHIRQLYVFFIFFFLYLSYMLMILFIMPGHTANVFSSCLLWWKVKQWADSSLCSSKGYEHLGILKWFALPLSILENPMNSMKRQNGRILKEELPRLVGAQYATAGQWRNNSRKNEGMEPKQKQYPAVDVTGDR